MSKFVHTVVVDCDTPEQATTVMAERLGPDEDYGFDYKLKWSTVGGTPGLADPATPAVTAQWFMLAVGNAFDGLTTIGPFDSVEAAHQESESYESWEVVPLQTPDYEPQARRQAVLDLVSRAMDQADANCDPERPLTQEDYLANVLNTCARALDGDA